MQVPDGKGGMKNETITVRNGINEITRLEYVKDCNVGVTRWNMAIKRAGVAVRLEAAVDALPSPGRRVGRHSDRRPRASPSRRPSSTRARTEWLPSEADQAYVKSLMQRVAEPGKMAAWIAPPDRGINAHPVDYEYVKL